MQNLHLGDLTPATTKANGSLLRDCTSGPAERAPETVSSSTGIVKGHRWLVLACRACPGRRNDEGTRSASGRRLETEAVIAEILLQLLDPALNEMSGIVRAGMSIWPAASPGPKER